MFPKIGVPQNGWFISWKTPLNMGWFGGKIPLFFSLTPICTLIFQFPHSIWWPGPQARCQERLVILLKELSPHRAEDKQFMEAGSQTTVVGGIGWNYWAGQFLGDNFLGRCWYMLGETTTILYIKKCRRIVSGREQNLFYNLTWYNLHVAIEIVFSRRVKFESGRGRVTFF